MKRSICIFLIFYIQILYGQAGIRSDFHSHDLSKDHLLEIINSDIYVNSPLVLGYKGLCETMLARYTFLPTTKLKSFMEGSEKVEQAIKDDPNNCELYYMRLMIQLNSPRFLNYHDNIAKDFQFFENTLHEQIKEDYWKLEFIKNLLLGKHITEEHRNLLLSLKKSCNE